MAMTIDLARAVHRERLAEAESRRRWREARRVARERDAAARDTGERDTGERKAKPERARGPAMEWPVFTLRIGRFQLVGFRTVRL